MVITDLGMILQVGANEKILQVVKIHRISKENTKILYPMTLNVHQQFWLVFIGNIYQDQVLPSDPFGVFWVTFSGVKKWPPFGLSKGHLEEAGKGKPSPYIQLSKL